jgi:CPA2 family monovalent cation:H+ antiporter-2
VARAHSEAEVDHLRKFQVSAVVMGERELALGMIDAASLGQTPGSTA